MAILTGLFIWNYALAAALTAWFVAQVSKVLLDGLLRQEFSWERLVGSGGMPSAHSASVIALTTALGLRDGMMSTTFAVAAVLAAVVMYDAAGIRQAAGRQAKAINHIIERLRYDHTLDDISLKELLGHTPVEVMVGAALGFITAYGGFWLGLY